MRHKLVQEMYFDFPKLNAQVGFLTNVFSRLLYLLSPSFQVYFFLNVCLILIETAQSLIKLLVLEVRGLIKLEATFIFGVYAYKAMIGLSVVNIFFKNQIQLSERDGDVGINSERKGTMIE